MDGKLDWTVGAFFMEHEIENHIRGYVEIQALMITMVNLFMIVENLLLIQIIVMMLMDLIHGSFLNLIL